jgi:hypothetical protein
VAGLVDAEEADCEDFVSSCVIFSVNCSLGERRRTVSVLPDLAVLRSIDGEGLVAGGGELFGVRVVERERDGFAAEPVADVVCVAVEEVDAKALVEQVLEVLAEVRVDEVAGVLELPGENEGVS